MHLRIIFFLCLFAMPSVGLAELPTSRRAEKAIADATRRLITPLAKKRLAAGSHVFIRILKEELELEVWLKRGDRFVLFKTYHIKAMSGKLGPKLKEGDRQAPEGFYFVPPSRMNPNSKFHLSFNLGYPNKYDRTHGRTGSALMVHGNKVSIGCYAMGDKEIEEIYALCHLALKNGQRFFRVHVFPFRMTMEKLAKHRSSRWHTFWLNLKEGYEWFEKNRVPPNVEVRGGRYVFDKAD